MHWLKHQSTETLFQKKEKKASSMSVAMLSSSKREADVLISASQCGSISHLEIRWNIIQTHSYNHFFLLNKLCEKNPQCDYKEINSKVILFHFYHWITATESRKIGRIHHWRNIFFNAFSMKISSVDSTRYLQRSSWWICKDNILIFSF